MNKKNFLLIFLSISLMMFSCGNESEDENNSTDENVKNDNTVVVDEENEVSDPDTVETVDELDEAETPDETECVPQCDGKSCGDDGCDGDCGECNIDEKCNDKVSVNNLKRCLQKYHGS